MAGQGFDPNFTFSWPSARIGVMEGESAIGAIYGPELEKLKVAGQPVPAELDAKIAQTRADYERWLDATVCSGTRSLRRHHRSRRHARRARLRIRGCPKWIYSSMKNIASCI